MSFEKLNEASINNKHDRSCILVVNFNKKERAKPSSKLPENS